MIELNAHSLVGEPVTKDIAHVGMKVKVVRDDVEDSEHVLWWTGAIVDITTRVVNQWKYDCHVKLLSPDEEDYQDYWGIMFEALEVLEDD